MKQAVRMLIVVVFALGLMMQAGCGGERTVGGACDSDADCNERCLTGSDFPGGMCTVACRDDVDCPGGTDCIDKKGGVCLPVCDEHRDCFGGYRCKSEDRRGAGGKSRVCIGD